MKAYKIITSETGIKELEQKVTEFINDGWNTLGGISFNHGYPYQAIIHLNLKQKSEDNSEQESSPKLLGANEGMKKINDLL